jgi:hypothetical protein
MQSLNKQIKRNCILFMMGILMVSCAKFDHKISTKVEGTVKYADGTPAEGVFVKLVQVLKTYEGTYSSTSGISIIQITETSQSGNYKLKFKDDERPEGYPKDFSDYFLCISKEFVDRNTTGKNIGMLSETTEVEFIRTNDKEVGENKNKIKTGRKNKINATIKN